MTNTYFFLDSAEMYDAIAPMVNEYYVEMHQVAIEIFNDVVLAHNSEKQIAVLDLGAGTGYATCKFLETCENTLLVAVDNDKKMVEQLHKKMRPEWEDRLMIVTKDMMSLTNADLYSDVMIQKGIDSFRVVFSAVTLHHFEQERRENIFRLAYSHLEKNDGIFIYIDLFDPVDDKKHGVGRKHELAYIKKQLDMEKQKGNGEVVYLLKEWLNHYRHSHRNLPEISETISLLKHIGFQRVIVPFSAWQITALVAFKK